MNIKLSTGPRFSVSFTDLRDIELAELLAMLARPGDPAELPRTTAVKSFARNMRIEQTAKHDDGLGSARFGPVDPNVRDALTRTE